MTEYEKDDEALADLARALGDVVETRQAKSKRIDEIVEAGNYYDGHGTWDLEQAIDRADVKLRKTFNAAVDARVKAVLQELGIIPKAEQ